MTTEQTRTRPAAPLTVSTGGEVVNVSPSHRRRRLVVDVRPLPARVTAPFAPLLRWRRPVMAYGVVVGVVGAGAYLLGASGTGDLLVRAAASLGLLLALGWLAYAGTSVHSHHCPGCRWH